MDEYLTVENGLKLAGLGQLILVAVSIAIPKCLNWKDGLAGLQPLLRQMFWMCVLMFVWWFARILIQFFYFDIEGLPVTLFNKMAEIGLVMLFAFLTVVYGWAIWENMAW